MMLQAKGDEKSVDEAEAYYLRCVEIDNRCVDAMFNWATLKLHCRKDPGRVQGVDQPDCRHRAGTQRPQVGQAAPRRRGRVTVNFACEGS